MKTRRVKGTVWTPHHGYLKGKHNVIDPLPEKAASGDELLEQFMNNLVEIYHKISPAQPVDAMRYITAQLRRLQAMDPETNKVAGAEGQEKFQDSLMVMFKRRAGLLKEAGEGGSVI